MNQVIFLIFEVFLLVITCCAKIKKKECGVIKYDCIEYPGNHGTFYFNDTKYSFVEFDDSFGIQPGNEIIDKLKTSNQLIAYHSTQVQNFNDVDFSHLCVDYIKRRFKKMDPHNFI